jgi:hypothetical protein
LAVCPDSVRFIFRIAAASIGLTIPVEELSHFVVWEKVKTHLLSDRFCIMRIWNLIVKNIEA